MKKAIAFSALALVAAISIPTLAMAQAATDPNTASGNNGSAIAQDGALAVTATEAENGGIANTSSGSVTKNDVSTETRTSTEAEKGGIIAGGSVTKDSNNPSTEVEKGGIISSGSVTKDSNNESAKAEKGGILADGSVTKDSNNATIKAKNGGIANTSTGTVNQNKDSNNSSVEAEKGGIVAGGNVMKDSGNADDGSIVATGAVTANKSENGAEEGGIAASGNVDKTDIRDSFNKQETEITVGAVTVMVSNSELSGEVESNTTDVGKKATLTTGNIANKGSALSSAAGITVIKQNTGMNSQMQTSVNVNSNLAK